MRSAILALLAAGALAGCNKNPNDQSARQGTSGSGKVYGRGGENQEIRAGASSTATDLRPTGGSMAGAGGAGPGYDGSGKGLGKEGTIPAPGAGFAGSLTNSQAATNQNTPSQPQTQSTNGPSTAAQPR
jgi:hypothetical protein